MLETIHPASVKRYTDAEQFSSNKPTHVLDDNDNYYDDDDNYADDGGDSGSFYFR